MLTLNNIQNAITDLVTETTIPIDKLKSILLLLSKCSISGFFTKEVIATLNKGINSKEEKIQEETIDLISQFYYYLITHGCTGDDLKSLAKSILGGVSNLEDPILSVETIKFYQPNVEIIDSSLNMLMLFYIKINIMHFMRQINIKANKELMQNRS